jgi:hypothetical protein
MLNELIEEIDELLEDYLKASGAICLQTHELGLDDRCGIVFISLEEGWICVPGSTRQIEYYGGFEYIDHCDKEIVGQHTFYSSDADRVRDALEYYAEQQESS